jgi:hypothetical protein
MGLKRSRAIPQRRKKMSQQATARVNEMFTLKQSAANTLRITIR